MRKYPKWLRHVKIRLILVVFVAGGVYLLAQVAGIKRVYGGDYERRALANLINNGQEADAVLMPARGEILDRNRKALAIGDMSYNVVMDVIMLSGETAEKRDKILDATAEALGARREDLLSYLAKDADGKLVYNTYYQYIAKGVPYDAAQKLKADGVRHIYLEETPRHTYPYNGLAAAVIGFVRGDGATGLERRYGNELTGSPGRVFRARGDDGFIAARREEPEDGHTLLLSLDFKLQQEAERIAQKYAEEVGALNASVIVMDPNTGELPVVAQYPTFNLNSPLDAAAVTRAEDAEALAALEGPPLIDELYKRYIWSNLNTSYTFEPGSIFKPITVAMALEEGAITANDTFYCPGYKEVAGYTIKCHKVEGHGHQTLDEAIANSCNVAMMNIAEKSGRSVFAAYQREFGFGQPTGIDLPGEERGLLFTEAELNASELATSSFGQRFRCTPIQAVTAFAAVINGGKLVQPHIVAQTVDAKGGVISANDTRVTRTVISKDTSDYLRVAMEKVVSAEGTGRRAVIEGYAIGGKTGTGEQGVKDVDEDYGYCLSFLTYLPVENPQYLVFVLLDRVPEAAYENGASPGPMMREMLTELIQYKDIPKSHGDAAAPVAKDMVVLEDYVGLTAAEATRRLNALGVNYQLTGDGGALVTGQTPNAGSPVPPGRAVVYLVLGGQEGAETALVPDVTGLPLAEAEAVLIAAGFEPVSVWEADADGDEEATGARVTAQQPERDKSLMIGAQVRLTARRE